MRLSLVPRLLLLAPLLLGACEEKGTPRDAAVDVARDRARPLDASVEAPRPGDRTADHPVTPPPDATMNPNLVIHFKKPAGWSTASIHTWATEPGRLQTTWPGTAMTAESGGWFIATLAGQKSAAIVFNDQAGQQSVDLARGSEGWFLPTGANYAGRVTGRWYSFNPDLLPHLEADPPGGSIYDGTLSVRLVAKGPGLGTVRYTLDGSDPALQGTTFADNATVAVGGGIAVGGTVQLRLFAQNGSGKASVSYTFVRRASQTVEAWDPADKPASVSRTGRFERLKTFNSDQGLAARDVMVYLPEDYDTSTRRYRVVYFHDGQNLFDKAEATYGAEWMVDERHDELVLEGSIEPAIVVGIYNAGTDRTREYVGSGADDAKAKYAAWLIHSLKPYVDQHYRTRPQAEYTTTMGSSFGGVISVYLSWNHPEVFGSAGCVSNAFANNGVAFLADLLAYQGAKKPVRYWIDAGFEEGDDYADGTTWYTVNNRLLAEKLASLGWKENDDLGYFEAVGEGHNETAWSHRIKKILYFLLRKAPPALIRIEARTTLPTIPSGGKAFALVDLFYENDFSLTKVFADKTAPLSLTSTSPTLVSVDPANGQLTPKSAGKATVEASYQGLSSRVEVNVQ